jgi:hypothetical protein
MANALAMVWRCKKFRSDWAVAKAYIVRRSDINVPSE